MTRSFRRATVAASIAAAALLTTLPLLPQAHAQDMAPTSQPAGKATITVTVVDKDSNPVAKARVALTMAPPPSTGDTGAPPARPKPLMTGTTDESGKAILSGVADGDYIVIARMRSAGNGRSKVTVSNGADADVSITLKARKNAGGENRPATQPG